MRSNEGFVRNKGVYRVDNKLSSLKRKDAKIPKRRSKSCYSSQQALEARNINPQTHNDLHAFYNYTELWHHECNDCTPPCTLLSNNAAQVSKVSGV